MVKTPCCEKVGLKRGKWTIEEDELLVKYIQTNGEGSWRSLPKNAGLLRCGKSCRLRWTNYLRPDLKRGKFTAEEDETIVKLHSSMGNRWSLIAQHLPGRTDNEIKNYWNTNLRRRIYTFRNLKGLIKTTAINVTKKVVDVYRDCEETSRKLDATIGLEGGSIGSLLLGNNVIDDIGSTQKNNSSLRTDSRDDTTLSEKNSIKSLLPEDYIVIDKDSTGKTNSSCLGSKDGATSSEEDSTESCLLKNYTIDIDPIQETNSSYFGATDKAMWPEERSSVEYLLTENYIVDTDYNGEIKSSCPGDKDEAIWSEEGSSIESLSMENYIVDLEFLTQSPPDEIKGLAPQQHEEEKEEDKNNKDINVIWSFEEQGQQIQGPHEQIEGNEIVLQQQINECFHNFEYNNWSNINFDYFLEEKFIDSSLDLEFGSIEDKYWDHDMLLWLME